MEEYRSAKIKVCAEIDKFESVLNFINEKLEENGCGMKFITQSVIAMEEIFVNVAHYAYPNSTGECEIELKLYKDKVVFTVSDSGIPFDPLAKEDPDITLSAEERKIGGLGIFMVKNIMDEVSYEYSNGKNCLTMSKKM